jgi:DNA processing protein
MPTELTPSDARYPDRLRSLPERPEQLWVSGSLPDPRAATVGIVGTRRCTPLGQRTAREIADAVARAGGVVVSGLAQGIDSCAHAAAVDAGGLTIAVLGEGVSHFSELGPHRRRALAARIERSGALVSEYALDVHPTDWTFPKRNATIAGLSDALVVVEAPAGSGALITADRMRELRRPLFAVPGPLGAASWAGSNDHLRRGWARLLVDVGDVLETVGLTRGEPRATASPSGDGRIVELLAAGPVDMDAIASALGITPADAATLLVEQLLLGTVAPTGDGRFGRA